MRRLIIALPIAALALSVSACASMTPGDGAAPAATSSSVTPNQTPPVETTSAPPTLDTAPPVGDPGYGPYDTSIIDMFDCTPVPPDPAVVPLDGIRVIDPNNYGSQFDFHATFPVVAQDNGDCNFRTYTAKDTAGLLGAVGGTITVLSSVLYVDDGDSKYYCHSADNPACSSDNHEEYSLVAYQTSDMSDQPFKEAVSQTCQDIGVDDETPASNGDPVAICGAAPTTARVTEHQGTIYIQEGSGSFADAFTTTYAVSFG